MTITLNGTTGISSPGGDTAVSLTATNLYTTGSVGIGTSSPAFLLDVQAASGDTTIRVKSNGGGGGGILTLDGNGSGSYPGAHFAQSGTNYWTIGQRGDTNLWLYQESGSGVVKTTTNLQFNSSNTGIIFNNSSALTNSTLNDYEVGTWTPSVGGNATYLINSARYTKTGNIVYIECDLQINVLGTGSSSVIYGLPFTINNSTSGGITVGYFSGLAIALYFISGNLNTNSNTIVMSSTTGSTGTINYPSGVFGNGARVKFTGFYSV